MDDRFPSIRRYHATASFSAADATALVIATFLEVESRTNEPHAFLPIEK